MTTPSNWIGKPWQDVAGILMPPFVALAFVIFYRGHQEVDPMWWLILVVFIDVAHVYSTLFRTYWSQETRQKYNALLWVVPLACFVFAVLLHMASVVWFWRIMAYAAVWHFIRQQYGFMRLYQRQDPHTGARKWISLVTIYAATFYPLLYWHLSGDRTFHWMVEGDFLVNPSPGFPWLKEMGVLYVLILVAYGSIESAHALRSKSINWPKNLVVLGTAVSWYFGIVYFNGDMAFTAINVVSHGIPYMTLIWLSDGTRVHNGQRTWKAILVFLLLVMALAFSEEALWDSLVWQDHPQFFEWLYPARPLGDRTLLNLLVPFLILPQLVHYILDGFIWRRKAA